MKFPIAYYLLFLYISVIFRPVILIGCDVYDHAFEEAIHIATVHAKYGSNHLEKGIADSSNDNNKSQSTAKSEDTNTVHLFKTQDYSIPHTSDQPIIYSDVLHQKVMNVFLSIQLPPPKYCA